MPDFDEAHDALVEHRKSKHALQMATNDDGTIDIPMLIELVQIDGVYFYSSLPNTTFKEKMQNAKYLTSKDNDIEELLDPKYFLVSDFILTKASFMDKDGKQVTTPKLVLIDKQGMTRNVLAKVWISEFLSLLQMFGLPPWPDEIVLSAKLMKGNGSNRYYGLHLP